MTVTVPQSVTVTVSVTVRQSVYDGGGSTELPDLHLNQSSAPDLTMNQSSELTSQLAQYDLMSDTNMDQLNLQIEKERSVREGHPRQDGTRRERDWPADRGSRPL